MHCAHAVADMVADIAADKVADKVADMVSDMFADIVAKKGTQFGKRKKMGTQFGERGMQKRRRRKDTQFSETVGHGNWLIWPSLFRPEAYPTCVSSKLCEFIS